MPSKQAVPAWDCCRIAFHTNIIDMDRVWKRLRAGLFQFPPGWTLTGTDCSGARSTVVIFDVDIFPTQADARAVRRELSKIREYKPRLPKND